MPTEAGNMSEAAVGECLTAANLLLSWLLMSGRVPLAPAL